MADVTKACLKCAATLDELRAELAECYRAEQRTTDTIAARCAEHDQALQREQADRIAREARESRALAMVECSRALSNWPHLVGIPLDLATLPPTLVAVPASDVYWPDDGTTTLRAVPVEVLDQVKKALASAHHCGSFGEEVCCACRDGVIPAALALLNAALGGGK